MGIKRFVLFGMTCSLCLIGYVCTMSQRVSSLNEGDASSGCSSANHEPSIPIASTPPPDAFNPQVIELPYALRDIPTVMGDPRRPSGLHIISRLRMWHRDVLNGLWTLFSRVRWRWGDAIIEHDCTNLFSFSFCTSRSDVCLNWWRAENGKLTIECVISLRRDMFESFRFAEGEEDIQIDSDL